MHAIRDQDATTPGAMLRTARMPTAPIAVLGAVGSSKIWFVQE